MGAAPTTPAGRPAGIPALAGPCPTLRSARGMPAAGCPASAPSLASWRPWRPVAPSPSSATAFTSTGSGVATPHSSAACGIVSETAAEAWPWAVEVPPLWRGPRGAHWRPGDSYSARATLSLQKEEPSLKRLMNPAPR